MTPERQEDWKNFYKLCRRVAALSLGSSSTTDAQGLLEQFSDAWKRVAPELPPQVVREKSDKQVERLTGTNPVTERPLSNPEPA
jgi:hypothetical protein